MRRDFASRILPGVGVALGLLLGPAPAAVAQDSTWQTITAPGVVRAAAVVDSVYIDRTRDSATVGGGDFASYLMARLGVNRFPPDVGVRVRVDSQRMVLASRIRDLPQEAQRALGPLFMLVNPASEVVANIGLTTAGPRAVHFRLNDVTIAGFPVPDAVLQSVMTDIGRQYPALTASGRDLFVEIPAGAHMQLVPGGVLLVAP